MKLAFRSLVLIVATLFFASFAAAQAPQFSPFSADMLMTTSAGPQGPREMNGKIYVGSGHMRINISSQGHDTAIITDFASRTVDVLMVEPKMYMEHKAGAMSRRGFGSPTDELKPFDPENPCANQPDITCKKIGTETISGRNCQHWEITDKNGKVLNVWVDPKLHFPVKTVGNDGTILLSNIKEGDPAASLFQIPSDFKKMDLNGMTPQGAGRPQ
jgi:hypothetical protein